MFSTIGVAINASTANITITAKSSINVNPFFILSHLSYNTIILSKKEKKQFIFCKNI